MRAGPKVLAMGEGARGMPQYRPRGFRKARCDFYVTDSARTITCASWCRNMQQKLEFETPADKNDWLECHCVRRAERATCPRAAALWRLRKGGGPDGAKEDRDGR